jgi:hypothetical protein
VTREAASAPSAGRRMALGLIPMFLLDVALPLVAFNVLSNHGWSTRNALVVGSAFPILGSVHSHASADPNRMACLLTAMASLVVEGLQLWVVLHQHG